MVTVGEGEGSGVDTRWARRRLVVFGVCGLGGSYVGVLTLYYFIMMFLDLCSFLYVLCLHKAFFQNDR